MRTQAYLNDVFMQPDKIGIREFRAKLADYVLNSEAPIAITRHGDTVGYFIPVRRDRTDAERQALREATDQLGQLLKTHGIDEEELISEFKRRRKRSK